MDPLIRRGVKRRSDWIRRHPGGTKEGFPGGALDYVRLSKADRDKVDKLFLVERRLKAGEVSSLVEKLTGDRLRRQRAVNLRNNALKNMRSKLSYKHRYHDETVVGNTGRMTKAEAELAASSSEDELTELARAEVEGNPFWYH